MTIIECVNCGKKFLLSYYSRKCVCGWSPDQEGHDDMGKRRRLKGRNKMNTVNVPANVTTSVPIRTTQDSWEVEVDTVHECSKVPKEQKILVELLAKKKIDALMKKYPNIEWLAYLIGSKEEPFIVKDIFVPNQEVTATTVDNISCPEWNELSCIGVIHSHHGMGNGFSGTDHEWINQNHNVSLCIAKEGIKGQVRFKTPCGALKIIPAVVKVRYPELDYDFETWLKESVEKIKTRTYQAVTYVTKGTARGYWRGGVFHSYEDEVPVKGGAQILTPAQKSYCNGVVVKGKEDDGWSSGLDSRGVKIDEEQSLADALKEFEETGNVTV